jgi:hypothetical protein
VGGKTGEEASCFLGLEDSAGQPASGTQGTQSETSHQERMPWKTRRTQGSAE